MEDIKIVGLSPKKSGGTNWKVISAIIGIIVLSIGVIAGILLVRQNQDVREKASDCSIKNTCTGTTLYDCPAGETDANESVCDRQGRIEMCNGAQYCCPQAGGNWTSDLSKCDGNSNGGGSSTTGGSNTSGIGNCSNPATIVQCPASNGNLYSCNPPDQNNNAQIHTCNVAGRKELCGVEGSIKEYCCPSAGGTWTTDMSACSCTITAMTGMTVEQITGTTAILKWVPGNAPTTRLWVSKNADPVTNCAVGGASNCILNDMKLTSTTTQYELTNLTPNTKYYWKIGVFEREGCDLNSSVMNFTTSGGSNPTATATSTSGGNRTSTPTATSTSRSTSTSTSRATATPRATARATSSGTAFPVPETGADFPTMLGVGFGVIMVLISLALAL